MRLNTESFADFAPAPAPPQSRAAHLSTFTKASRSAASIVTCFLANSPPPLRTVAVNPLDRRLSACLLRWCSPSGNVSARCSSPATVQHSTFDHLTYRRKSYQNHQSHSWQVVGHYHPPRVPALAFGFGPPSNTAGLSKHLRLEQLRPPGSSQSFVGSRPE